MIKKIKFGECLNLLLSALNISSNRLAKELNVDASLVSRWLHEKRTPSYRTDYVEAISDFLSSNILNSYQFKHINDVINKICEDFEVKMPIRDKISKILLESQGYSLECKKNSIVNNSKIVLNNINVIKKEKLLNLDLKIPKMDYAPEFGDNINYTSKIIDLSPEDKLIVGNANILNMLISLLKIAIKQHNEHNDTIYLSFNNDSLFLTVQENYIELKNILTELIKNGWKIICLIKIPHDFRKVMNFINFVNSLILTGKFVTYYYKKYDIFTAGKEIIVIPGIGVLSCYSTTPNGIIDFALYISNPIGIIHFKKYFNGIISKFAEKLAKYFYMNESLEYTYSLIKSEEESEKRFLLKDNFSTLTLSLPMYEKLLALTDLQTDRIFSSIELFKIRSNAFLTNLQYYVHTDIYRITPIQQLIINKQISFSSPYGIHKVNVEIEDIINHLENILYLLKTYDNYNIVFVNENIVKRKEYRNFNCILKSKHTVTLEDLKSAKNTSKIRLKIEEPIIVETFELYFKEVLEEIAPINKNRPEIIKWFEHQISVLKNKQNILV